MASFGGPRRPEIDQYAIKFLIGAIAFLLSIVEWQLTGGSISSISASFWYDKTTWPRDIFVGSLFAIAALLTSYNGVSALEMWLSKLAAISAMCITLFPCNCEKKSPTTGFVHDSSAATMFFILTLFCFIFLIRAWRKQHTRAKIRAGIYVMCAVGMIVSLMLFLWHALGHDDIFLLRGETVGLISFGVSWLAASKVLPGISAPAERTRLIVAR